MQRILMRSKIHRATVTGTALDYAGSITIDRVLMDAADIVENEKVQVANLSTGARFETYVIPGEAGSGVVQLNGAAARLAEVGDQVIVIAYGLFAPDELPWVPTIVHVTERNAAVVTSAVSTGSIS